MFGIWYTTSSLCRLVVYQVPNLQVPYHYANLVRLWLRSVVIQANQKNAFGSIRSRARGVYMLW
jgi:hypothetical protein